MKKITSQVCYALSLSEDAELSQVVTWRISCGRECFKRFAKYTDKSGRFHDNVLIILGTVHFKSNFFIRTNAIKQVPNRWYVLADTCVNSIF